MNPVFKPLLTLFLMRICAVVQPVRGWLVVFHCSNAMVSTGFGTAMSTLVLEDPQLLPLPRLSPNSDSNRAELSEQSLDTLTFTACVDMHT